MENSKEIKDFEELLKSKNDSDIKYTIDTSIESSVKYDYLVEVYGKDNVNSVVENRENLFDTEYYSLVLSELEKIAGL
jgi:hypothetical protein